MSKRTNHRNRRWKSLVESTVHKVLLAEDNPERLQRIKDYEKAGKAGAKRKKKGGEEKPFFNARDSGSATGEKQRKKRLEYQPSDGQLKNAFKKLSKALEAGDVPAVHSILDSGVMTSQAAMDVLRDGINDGDESGQDDVINFQEDAPKIVGNMIPTQGFIDCNQSIAGSLGSYNLCKKYANGDSTPVKLGGPACSGNHILDGHHRWSAVCAINPAAKAEFNDFDMGEKNAGQKLATMQVAVATQRTPGAKLPAKGGDASQDIMGKSGPEIADLIATNIAKECSDPFVAETEGTSSAAILSDDFMQKVLADADAKVLSCLGVAVNNGKFVDANGKEIQAKPASECTGFSNLAAITCPVRAMIVKKVGQNCAAMQPKDSTGPDAREDMPQLDHVELSKGGGQNLKDLESELPQGTLNVADPFIEESIDLRRWNKLAGLLKD